MEYNAPVGAADPDDPYIDGNPGTGTEGSAVPAAAIEYTQREIVNAIIGGGITPDNGDLTQLYDAIVAIATALVQPTPTGKIEPTYDNAAGSGWLFLNGDTIGDVGSGATHAAADCEDLFKWFWARLGNTYFAVSGGRGASAQADWDAGKTGTMPDWRGRAPIGAGTGSGLTNRVLGSTGGEETHDQTTAEMPEHTHTITLGTRDLQGGSNSAYYDGTGASETSSSAGSGDPFNVMQPWTAVNWQIKK